MTLILRRLQMFVHAHTAIMPRVGLVQLVFLETKRTMDNKKDRGFPRPFLLEKQLSEIGYRILVSREPKVEILELSYHFDSRLMVDTKNLGNVVNDLFVDCLIDAVDDCF